VARALRPGASVAGDPSVTTLDRMMLKAVVAVLKKRFNNLGAEELIELATDILVAVTEVGQK